MTVEHQQIINALYLKQWEEALELMPTVCTAEEEKNFIETYMTSEGWRERVTAAKLIVYYQQYNSAKYWLALFIKIQRCILAQLSQKC